MPSKHCPLCNNDKVFAVGAVAYADGVVVEHRCARCGHMFYLKDLRNVAPQPTRTNQIN